MQVFQNSDEEPKVPQWIINMLEAAYPPKEALAVKSFEDLRYHQGIHHVIEFLKARSSNPYD